MSYAIDQAEIIECNKERQKLMAQLKQATSILRAWDRYGDEYGCSNDAMNKLFLRTASFLQNVKR